ncbi:hypothetical protein [Fundidesulfovibrio magnetotacticus]|uniref:hypothetical protein n=1 Tax=Fundidesulfovibrio magnetotacticus TaxID=2730080 RepID=UPI001564F6DA|nr:hypothetical protein [Fundidesulfovibrio magnetotacticus]
MQMVSIENAVGMFNSSVVAIVAVDMFLAAVGVFKKARTLCGLSIMALSYLIGIGVWLISAIFVYAVWGFWGLVVGLCGFFVGVVPVAMAAAMYHGKWSVFLWIIVMMALAFGSRFLGAYVASRA